MNIVAILAGGVGERFGSNVPKQFHNVNGKMVIEYVIEAILQAKKIDKLVIASNIKANSVYLADICKKHAIDLIDNGNTRNKTLKNVIDYVEQNFECKNLIVCDAVRPMITPQLIDKYFDLLNHNDAVVTARKITDSLGCYDIHKVDRERFYLMQSPEGFDFPLLRDSFDENSHLTEVTQQLPENSRIYLDFDFNNNFKLTYPADLKYLEALLTDRDNHVDFSKLLQSVTRLNFYLEKYYPVQTKLWADNLKNSIDKLLKNWQITKYDVIKSSHFGIIFLAESIKYGKCVLKIIPPFIERYIGERSCYQSINKSFMCELLDYDDSCSAILLECCDDAGVSFGSNNKTLFSFFEKVMNNSLTEKGDSFKNYREILCNKLREDNFTYKKDIIMNYVAAAVEEMKKTFSTDDEILIHGDLHRYNIMQKNGELVAIDPIGYVANKEFDIVRYIGTELTDGEGNIKEKCEEMLTFFAPLSSYEKLKSALFIDIVFRLHNSLFENSNYDLTDKWLNVLKCL